MPIYEYECLGCDHKFEEVQKITDPPIKSCPVCKKKKVKRLISQSSFTLKGDGWFASGYSKGKKESE